MANPTAVSFWLDNKRVNGTAIAEDGAVKLVKYGSKFYVVEGKDPERRSYSQSTLPTKWKKIVSGEIADSTLAPLPTASAEGKSAQDTPGKRRTKGPTAVKTGQTPPSAFKPNDEHGESGRLVQSPQAPQSSATVGREVKPQSKPRKPSTKADAERDQLELETALPPAQAQEAGLALVQTPAMKLRAPRVAKAKAVPEVSIVEKVQTPTKSATMIGAKLNKQETVTRGKVGALDCLCPYCQHKRKVLIAEAEIDKPVVVICAGCRKEFVLRIVTSYQAQVAGFI